MEKKGLDGCSLEWGMRRGCWGTRRGRARGWTRMAKGWMKMAKGWRRMARPACRLQMREYSVEERGFVEG